YFYYLSKCFNVAALIPRRSHVIELYKIFKYVLQLFLVFTNLIIFVLSLSK
ncbi:hypothetical protein L9F63_019925, partial [Diploptera punctata]